MKIICLTGVERIYINTINTANYDHNCIKTALNNIFNFRLGEEILEPMFGNDLYRYLYEPMNKYTADKINRTIRQMIEDWEPRIEIVDLPIEGDSETMTYHIKLKYFVPALNETGEYNFILSQLYRR